jgi:hypothetical protein
MRILHTLVVMFIGSFIIQYFFMSTIMSGSMENITNSLGKVYLSIIMGLYMIVLEIMMHDHQYSVFSMKYYIIIGCLLGFFIYLYRLLYQKVRDIPLPILLLDYIITLLFYYKLFSELLNYYMK